MYVRIHVSSGTLRDQKKLLDLLGLDLQVGGCELPDTGAGKLHSASLLLANCCWPQGKQLKCFSLPTCLHGSTSIYGDELRRTEFNTDLRSWLRATVHHWLRQFLPGELRNTVSYKMPLKSRKRASVTNNDLFA